MEKTVRRKTIERLFGLLAPRRFQYMVSMTGMAVLISVQFIFIGYILKMFSDAILGKHPDQLWHTLRIYLLFLIIYFPLLNVLNYLWQSIIVKAGGDIRRSLFRHINRLPLHDHDLRHSGDLISVITNDVGIMTQVFGLHMYNLFVVGVLGISCAVFIMILNWKLAFIVIAAGILPLVINIPFAKPLRNVSKRIQNNLGRTSGQYVDLLAGCQVVRTFHLNEWALSRFHASNRELLENSMHRVRLNSSLAAANHFGSNVNRLLTLGVGTYMVISGHITFGVLVAVYTISAPVLDLVTTIGTTISNMQRSLAAGDRVLDLLDAACEPESYHEKGAGPIQSPEPDLHIECCGVCFGYAPDQTILQGISFDVPEGKTVALVGPSGCGKSTVFKLLLGCYPIGFGNVFLKGKSINNYPLEELRDLFAYIPQDAYLYSQSIMENIRYGRLDASDEEVMAAAKIAYTHDFISRFPDSYQTRVGERGARLSGGERQRIAIARALLKDAPILLLDEATSALDSESEEIVQQALQRLMAGRTVLIIAHRLSTVEHADVIYAIDGGKVVESGNHEELLALKGLYSNMYAAQFNG